MKIGQIFKLIISIISLVADIFEENDKEKETKKDAEKEQKK